MTKQIDHSKANVYLELCNKAGGYFKDKNYNPKLPEGWKKADYRKEKHSNFKGVLYRNSETGEYVIVNCGTDFSSMKDIGTDVKMMLKLQTGQSKDAAKFYEDMKELYRFEPEDCTNVGNSQGGSEVTHVIGTTDAQNGITFNPYQAINLKNCNQEKLKEIVNYRTEKDVVSKCGETVGEDFIVPVKDGVSNSPIQHHRIDNIDDCTKAIPAKEYEAKTGKKFINKYGDKKITDKDVEDIPKELYPLADKDISERLATGNVEKTGAQAGAGTSSGSGNGSGRGSAGSSERGAGSGSDSSSGGGSGGGNWVTINGNHVLLD